MSYTKTRSRDQNRYVKKYGFVRVPPRPHLITDRVTIIEAVELSFSNVSSVEHVFDSSFPGTPVVTATALDSESNSTANVNVFIKSLSSTNVTIGTSETFTGTIMMQAIYVDCP